MNRRRPKSGARRARAGRREAARRCACGLPPSRRPGFFQEPARGLASTSGAFHICICAGPWHAEKRAAKAARSGKFDALHKIYAKHLKTAQAKEELDELSARWSKSPARSASSATRRDHRPNVTGNGSPRSSKTVDRFEDRESGPRSRCEHHGPWRCHDFRLEVLPMVCSALAVKTSAPSTILSITLRAHAPQRSLVNIWRGAGLWYCTR